MADMNIYQPQSGDIYEPVDRAQKFREQQNALARQQAVRNALAQSIDPRTGRTNWQQAYAMGGVDVAPELQGMQSEETQRITREDADYLKQKREQLEMYVNDQASYDAWMADVKAHHPYASFPPTFSPEVKDQLSGFSRRLELAGRTGTGFQTLTPEEEQQLGLPTGVVAQRGPKNDIKIVYQPKIPPASRSSVVDAAKYPNLYKAIAEKRIPISRVNSRTAAIFEGVLGIEPDADLTGMNEEQIRNLAGARTGGVTQQNLEMAGTEARNMISVARNAAKAANLSELKAINQFTRWLGGQAGNPKYAALNTAINSLVNSYARAINPRGVPTVSDKQHAREILDSAMAAGNLEAAFNMMLTEIDAAHAAAAVGPGGKKPPAAAPASAPSGKTVVRTGTVNNRKVVQYNDGSIEYAD